MYGWQAPSLPVSPKHLLTSQPSYLPTFLHVHLPLFHLSHIPITFLAFLYTFLLTFAYLPPAFLTTFSPTLRCISAKHWHPKPWTHLFQRLSSDGVTVATIMIKINKQLFCSYCQLSLYKLLHSAFSMHRLFVVYGQWEVRSWYYLTSYNNVLYYIIILYYIIL